MLAVWTGASVCAAPFTSGNVIVANGDIVTEYTPAGSVVQSVPVQPPNDGSSVLVRDAVIDLSGRLHVMTFEPGTIMMSERAWLSTFDPLTGGWQHNTIDGWSLSGVTYYGGLGISDKYVFAPDLQTGGGEHDGIIRFPLNDLSSPERFHEVPGYGYDMWHAVKVGLDGYVYALTRGGSPNNLRRYDPDTMDELASFGVHKGASVMSVAVDANSDIYTIDLDGDIHHFNGSGTWIKTVPDAGSAGVDIEIFPDSTLLLGSGGGTVTITDTTFSTFSTIDTSDADRGGVFDVDFVAFTAVVPEPSTTFALAAFGLLVLGYCGWKRRKRS